MLVTVVETREGFTKLLPISSRVVANNVSKSLPSFESKKFLFPVVQFLLFFQRTNNENCLSHRQYTPTDQWSMN